MRRLREELQDAWPWLLVIAFELAFVWFVWYMGEP